jgi:hypothetical protein
MNITNLTYTEIQNLAIQADIESFNTGKSITLLDVASYAPEAEKPRTTKPLPFFIESVSNVPSLPNNINKRIRLRDHSNYAINNFLLVKESTLVNPDKNIISVESAIGKILKTAERGESFTCNGVDYTVIDIFPTPKVRQENV